MLKIFNYDAKVSAVFDGIRDGFLDYMPGAKFREVSEIKNADVIFMTGEIDSTGTLNFHLSGVPNTLRSLSFYSELYRQLAEKDRVIWLDTMGPSICRDTAIFDAEKTGLRDTDILVSPVSLPERPCTFTDVSHVEKSVFRQRERFERVKGSVMMCYDNLGRVYHRGDVPGMLAPNMDVISHLYVGTRGMAIEPDLETTFGNAWERVFFENFTYPSGIIKQLSQAEFVLTTHTVLGIELLGIEAGMCGCQPIYPDTEFYRDAFDGTGVVFYDTENAQESLRLIIQEGSRFDKKTTEAFRTKFSAEDTLPKFWDQVYALYSS